MQQNIDISRLVSEKLDALKAEDVVTIDVTKFTDITDKIIIATGSSGRHVKSIAKNLVGYAKEHNFRPFGVEDDADGNWVLIDYVSVVVHIMREETRSLYDLESLWKHTCSQTDK